MLKNKRQKVRPNLQSVQTVERFRELFKSVYNRTLRGQTFSTYCLCDHVMGICRSIQSGNILNNLRLMQKIKLKLPRVEGIFELP